MLYGIGWAGVSLLQLTCFNNELNWSSWSTIYILFIYIYIYIYMTIGEDALRLPWVIIASIKYDFVFYINVLYLGFRKLSKINWNDFVSFNLFGPSWELVDNQEANPRVVQIIPNVPCISAKHACEGREKESFFYIYYYLFIVFFKNLPISSINRYF